MEETAVPITSAEAIEKVDAWKARMVELEETITQREWLQITGKIDRGRKEILSDENLKLLALAWIHAKREHGGAQWEPLLDLTDTGLLEFLGISSDVIDAYPDDISS